MKITRLGCLCWESQDNLILGNVIWLLMVQSLKPIPYLENRFVTKQEHLPFRSKRFHSFLEKETAEESYKIFTLGDTSGVGRKPGMVKKSYTSNTRDLSLFYKWKVSPTIKSALGLSNSLKLCLCQKRHPSWKPEKWRHSLWCNRQCREAQSLLNHPSLESEKSKKAYLHGPQVSNFASHSR